MLEGHLLPMGCTVVPPLQTASEGFPCDSQNPAHHPISSIPFPPLAEAVGIVFMDFKRRCPATSVHAPVVGRRPPRWNHS
jgi:hypothetical protein